MGIEKSLKRFINFSYDVFEKFLRSFFMKSWEIPDRPFINIKTSISPMASLYIQVAL
jgi:hypothetical protein